MTTETKPNDAQVPMTLDDLSPEVRALLADPAKYKALRKNVRVTIGGTLRATAASIVKAAIDNARATVEEQTGKRVRSIVVKGDGRVTVGLQMSNRATVVRGPLTDAQKASRKATREANALLTPAERAANKETARLARLAAAKAAREKAEKEKNKGKGKGK